MTGIAGLISKSNKPVGPKIIKMLGAIAHRGTDNISIFLNDNYESLDLTGTLDPVNLKGSIGFGGCWNDRSFNQMTPVGTGSFQYGIDGDVKNIIGLVNEDSEYNTNNPDGLCESIIDQAATGFSMCLLVDDQVLLLRDIIGLKSLYFCDSLDYIAFATEKKALWSIGCVENIIPIKPGGYAIINGQTKSWYQKKLRKISSKPVQNNNLEECISKISELLSTAVVKHIKNDDIALLFSGGLDSCILAQILKNHEYEICLYNAGFPISRDRAAAIKAGKIFGMPIKFIDLTDELISGNLDKIVYHLETNDTVTAEIATPFYFISKHAQLDGFTKLMTGQGADELFGGYNRYEKILIENGYPALECELIKDIQNIWQKNVARDEKICMANDIELIIPYLNRQLVEFVTCIDPKLKLKNNDAGTGITRKFMLREVGRAIGLDNELIDLPKTAIQYGSGTTKSFRRIADESLKEFNLNLEKIRKVGFRSSNEFLLNLIAYRLDFPTVEIKNYEFIKAVMK